MDRFLLEAYGVDFSYGSHRVLRDINLKIPAGSYISIVGPNGSGKSTLFNLLCGARRCENGTVLYEGREVAQMGVMECARQFAVVHQNEGNCFPFTCLEMVILGLHPYRSRFGTPTEEQMKTVRSVMEHTNTLHLSRQPVTEISGGEFQRVILARAIVQRPRVLFLDEAMSGLDICAKIKMTKYLNSLIAQAGLTVVAINHDLAAAYQYSNCIVALRDGRVAACGVPREVMDSAFFTSIFNVEAEIFEGKGFFIRDNI